jgi:hypothetical protein
MNIPAYKFTSAGPRGKGANATIQLAYRDKNYARFK